MSCLDHIDTAAVHFYQSPVCRILKLNRLETFSWHELQHSAEPYLLVQAVAIAVGDHSSNQAVTVSVIIYFAFIHLVCTF